MSGRKPSKSPTQRTLDRLRQNGYRAIVVEKWVDHHDPSTVLNRAADILARSPGPTVIVEQLRYQAKVRQKAGPPGVRIDAFGIGDVLAISPASTLLVQACSASTLAAHVAKLMTEPLPLKGCELCDPYIERVKELKRAKIRITLRFRCLKHLAAVEWLNGPGRRLEVWGWRALSPRGTKRVKWEPNVRVMTKTDIVQYHNGGRT